MGQGNVQCVKTGLDVLRESGFKLLEGKRVGLVTNPTGVDENLVSTVDILASAPNVDLVALYGPEHGVRGDVHAGETVSDCTDPRTGLPVYSLYGTTRKATPEMLKGVDVMVYDIQDNGCRSYTFISTLGLLMEACAEQGKDVVVLDRPDPLGGNKVEGAIVEPGYESFVGQFPIPYIYGLTCGELAGYLDGEGLIRDDGGNVLHCDLTVVPMEGWHRNMLYADTGLPWVPSSPHIPEADSPLFYPASGILGEFSGFMNIGVGYTLPFKLYGAEWINDAEAFADSLNALEIPGVLFRPIYYTPFYGGSKGKDLGGVQLYFTDFEAAPVTDIQFYVMQVVAKMFPDHKAFDGQPSSRLSMFDKVTGSSYMRENFSRRYLFEDVREYWHKDNPSFREASKRYWLYN
ncbi:MAG: DUF1343 domain-containing protein [Bacteroidales bacterium]|jgi:uncharacterized protein YbbC (DUF1343 family)|nr:DUF1343 domain-containing protein [Bacteroidales bacterium]MCI2122020.1 DUF1343 domain-containing protein [Bacteroidales bacterium]MCI2146225.1 DUF1343 domain-containing protein [Bacteroidales bacterium]